MTSLRLIILLGLLIGVLAPAAAQQTDAETGLIIAGGWEDVRANCIACHSAAMITQNSGSISTWRSRIRWMQATQGLWELESELEASILDYLSSNYGEKTASRRPLLAPELLPPNPYLSDLQ